MYFCGVCGYSTMMVGNAKRHYLRHTGEKSSACPYCGYATFRMDNLKKHIEKHGVQGR
jgi:KRAB domain-containing zinc finger protein